MNNYSSGPFGNIPQQQNALQSLPNTTTTSTQATTSPPAPIPSPGLSLAERLERMSKAVPSGAVSVSASTYVRLPEKSFYTSQEMKVETSEENTLIATVILKNPKTGLCMASMTTLWKDSHPTVTELYDLHEKNWESEDPAIRKGNKNLETNHKPREDVSDGEEGPSYRSNYSNSRKRSFHGSRAKWQRR